MVICYLGIGSNLGDRKKNIKAAVKKIIFLRNTRVIKFSRIIETEPLGCLPGQDKFLNAVLKIETNFTPMALLRNLKKIERELGRVNPIHCGPRTIDLDILFYGNKIINKKELKVPHSKMFERDFVLKPLSEII